MTRLEDLWDELPTGTPPVDEILRSGRAKAARRHRVIRPLIAVGAAAAIIGAFFAGAAIGDGPGRGTPQAAPSPVAFQADLDPAQTCDELLTSYRDRAIGLVTAYGWDHFHDVARADGSARELSRLGSQAAYKMSEQGSSDTGTNVQEQGVDEPDTVKTDGTLVVRLRGDDLVVYDASGASMVKRSTTRLPRFEQGEILLVDTTVVAIGADTAGGRATTGEWGGSRVITVDIEQPSEPRIESTVTYSSNVISARQHGAIVRLVLSEGLPELDFVEPGKGRTASQALAANRRLVQASTIEDWLPTHDTGSGDNPLLDCTDVAIPPDAAGVDTVSVVGFTATTPTTPHTIGLAGGSAIAYESADHLYLVNSPSAWGAFTCGKAGLCTSASTGTAHIYDFELDGVNAIHVASGEVEGTIADRWSLDEADDVLRIAVGPSSETGNFNSVVTFQRQGQELGEIGRLGRLGINEDLKGVRWFDDLAVIVTYREIDPLFTIDLANPAAPRLIGKLKIPGYSDYLHPIGDDQMLGIGYEGSSAQIALFDTSDLADVRRIDVELYRRSAPVATWDPRAFTWLPTRSTALTVLQKGRAVQIAALTIRDGEIRTELTKVEYGDDVGVVRTVPLTDGRIALVTGEDVRFFDLP